MTCKTCNWFSVYECAGKDLTMGECQNLRAVDKTTVFEDEPACPFWEKE